jgi:hypothetical protein
LHFVMVVFFFFWFSNYHGAIKLNGMRLIIL